MAKFKMPYIDWGFWLVGAAIFALFAASLNWAISDGLLRRSVMRCGDPVFESYSNGLFNYRCTWGNRLSVKECPSEVEEIARKMRKDLRDAP